MTVREVIEAADRRKPNLYSREEKLRWLEEAEGMVWGALEAFHAVRGSFEGFDLEAWPDKQLMLPKPYTGLYYLWLEGSISYADQDFTLYNNAMSRFNALWREHSPARKILPLSVKKEAAIWKCPHCGGSGPAAGRWMPSAG